MNKIAMSRPVLFCWMTPSTSNYSREMPLRQIVEDYVEVIFVGIRIIATDFRDF
jgi:hypothetical protein